LHQRDNNRLIATMKQMRDLDNTLIVVEHDEDTMLEADWIVDIGPGAGDHGGMIVAEGTPQRIMKSRKSLTGQYLSGKKYIPYPTEKRKTDESYLEVVGAKENNLKDIDVSFPIGLLTLVTVVSGSGKSTLVNEILYKSISQHLYKGKQRPGAHKTIKGLEYIDKIIDINQA